MSQHLVRQGHKQAKKYLLIQATTVLVVAIAFLLKELQVAIALLSGGMVVVIANFYFVYKVFSHSGARATQKVVSAFYLGESIKMVISAGMLAVVFVWFAENESYVLSGYVLAYLLQWIVPAIVTSHK